MSFPSLVIEPHGRLGSALHDVGRPGGGAGELMAQIVVQKPPPIAGMEDVASIAPG